jgi:hypothetical protein
LRQTRPNAERPYKAFGYPIIPLLYIIGAAVILVVLFHLSNGNNLARTDNRLDGNTGLLHLEESRHGDA